MPFFPKVTSPCPVKNQLAAFMDGDTCRMCERRVFDLTDWSDGERRAFLAGCAEEVCVSYRLPLRSTLTAAAVAASAAMAPAALAQDAPVAEPAVAVEADAGSPDVEVEEVMVIVGEIKDPSQAEFVEAAEDTSVPELPVVYEDEADAAPTAPDAAAPPASPAS